MEIVQFNENKTISNLVEKGTKISILEYINKELDSDEYNFIVKEEDLPKAKSLMASLNKNIQSVKEFCKSKIDLESADIETLKLHRNEYVSLIQKKRDQIEEKVNVYIIKKKKDVKIELDEYLAQIISSVGIRNEFVKVSIDDLVITGNVTPKGVLKKSAKDAVEARVGVCKSKQDKYDMRLKDLEIESLKAGLGAPLTLTHIQGIIYLDDDNEYNDKLNALIADEINRNEVIKAEIQKEADAKAQREAHQEVLDGQNRINSIFNDIAKDGILSIDEKIRTIDGFDFSQFAQLESFARAKAQSVISELNDFKRQSEKEKFVSKPLAEVHPQMEIVRENIPFTQEEKVQQIKEASNDKKVVTIQAIFEVVVPGHISSDSVLSRVRSRLSECDINDDTLKSLEVV